MHEHWNPHLFRIGDYITLFNEASNGYLSYNGFNKNVLNIPYVYHNQSKENPLGPVNMKEMVFEITIVFRYVTMRKYEKMQLALGTKDQLTVEDKQMLALAKNNAENETKDNLTEMRRNLGRPVKFGEMVQLRHVSTGYFVHVDSKNMSMVSICDMRCIIKPSTATSSYFYIQPRYKVRTEGEVVLYNDWISFESHKFKGHFLGAYMPFMEVEEDNNASDSNFNFHKPSLEVPCSTAGDNLSPPGLLRKDTTRRPSIHEKILSPTRRVRRASTIHRPNSDPIKTLHKTIKQSFSTSISNNIEFTPEPKIKKIVHTEVLFTINTGSTIATHGFLLTKSQSVITRHEDIKANLSKSVIADKIHGLDFVRLYHQELSGYLSSVGCLEKAVENVHLRMRTLDPTNLRTFFPSSNPNIFWQIELQRCPFSSEWLEWDDMIRFKHATTGLYLGINADDNSVIMVRPDCEDQSVLAHTVFRLHPVIRGVVNLVSNQIGLMEFMLSGRGLQVCDNKEYEKQSSPNKMGSTLRQVQYDNQKLKSLATINSCNNEDAFKLEKVEDDVLQHFLKVTSMYKVLRFVRDKIRKENYCFPGKEFSLFVKILQDFRDDMFNEDGEVSKERQKCLRSVKVIDLLMDIIQIIIKKRALGKELSDSEQLVFPKINSLAFQILYNYLLGKSEKNRLYCCRYFDMLHKNIHLKGKEGKSVMVMLNKLVENNRTIIDRLKAYHVDPIISLLKYDKNYLYLIFLVNFCVCKDSALPKNQQYIIEEWFLKDKRGLCFFRTGQSIDRIRNLLYISTDTEKTYGPLHVFVDESHPKFDINKFKYLTQQLNLFISLCGGRNRTAIHLITIQMELIRWDSAFLCLKSDIMPYDIRAKFCEAMVAMFINVGDRYSVVEHTVTAIDYHQNLKAIEREEEELEEEHFEAVEEVTTSGTDEDASTIKLIMKKHEQQTEPFIRDLMQWSLKFLQENISMIPKQISKNVFFIQLFKTLTILVKFGYYFDTETCEIMVNAVLNVLDGKSDLPFPKPGRLWTKEEVDLLNEYRDGGRYQVKYENRDIMLGKIAGIEVLQLVMDQLRKKRIEEFVKLFIATNMYSQNEDNILKCLFLNILDPKFDPESEKPEDEAKVMAMKRKLKELFHCVEVIDRERLQFVMLDLGLYKNDDMIQTSAAVLCKYFFSKQSMFDISKRIFFCMNEDSQKLHNYLKIKMPQLIILTGSQWSLKNCTHIKTVFEELIYFCKIPDAPKFPHSINQMILYSHGIWELLEDIINKPQQTIVGSGEENDIGDEIAMLDTMYHFMLVWSKGNKVLSRKVFGQMTFILSRQHNMKSKIRLFCDILRVNPEFADEISESQLKTYVQILCSHTEEVPEAACFLCVAGLDMKTGKVNMKTLLLITKLVMQNYSTMKIFEGKNWNEIRNNEKQRIFFVTFMELLYTCCAIDRDYIESMCMKIYPLDLVLNYLDQENLSLDMKATLVKFFNEVFITVADADETKFHDIPDVNAFWSLLSRTSNEMRFILRDLEEIINDPDLDSAMKIIKLMKAQEEKHIISSWDVMSENEQKVHYVVHGLIPLGTAMLNNIFLKEEPSNSDNYQLILIATWKRTILEEFIAVLNKLACFLTQFVVNQYQAKIMFDWMKTMESLHDENYVEVENASLLLGHCFLKNLDPDHLIQLHFLNDHENELELYDKFLVFVERSKQIYEGKNSVEVQVYNAENNDSPYTEIGTIQELPLGEDFQFLLHTFVDNNYADDNWKEWHMRYRYLTVLISQIKSASKCLNLKGKEFERQEELNIRCLQVLRGIINNEVKRLPPGYENDIRNPDVIFQLRHIRSIQKVLDGSNCHDAVSGHLFNYLSPTAKHIYAFYNCLFFNVAQECQEAMINYFASTRVETFFFAMDMSFKHLIANLTENRSKERNEMIERMQKKKSPDAEKKQIVVQANIMLEKINTLITQNEEEGKKTLFSQAEKQLNMLEDGSGECIMHIMAAMCDGQYQPLQDYLRIQEDNFKSYNIVMSLCSVVGKIYANIFPSNIDVLTAVLDTLVELSVGNQDNRMTLFNNKIVDYLNLILRTREFIGCQPEQVLALRDVSATLMIALVEENGGEAEMVAREIMETIDVESIFHYMTQLYNMAKPSVEPDMEELVHLSVQHYVPKTYKEKMKQKIKDFPPFKRYRLRKIMDTKIEMFDIGFKYYFILARFYDLDPKLESKLDNIIFERAGGDEEGLTSQYKSSFKTYQKESESIEIVKDNYLQRVHFRVASKDVLREEVKEIIKWDVDRSSIATKQRDFLSWVDSVLTDVIYSTKYLTNPVLQMLTSLWFFWNWIPAILSLAIAVVSCITLKSQWSLGDEKPKGEEGTPKLLFNPVPKFREDMNLSSVLLILSIIHTVFCTILFASFLLGSHPGFENIKELYKSIRSLFKGKLSLFDEHAEHEIIDEYTEPERINKLEVDVFGFTTFYYFALFALSLLGTLFGYYQVWGYFLFSAHLINIFTGNIILQGVLAAIKETYIALISVFVLATIVLYIMSIIAFAFLRSNMDPEDNWYCSNLAECFACMVRQGLMYDKWMDYFFPKHESLKTFENIIYTHIVSILVFIFIPIILLNIIMGITVDKFADLRDRAYNKKTDMISNCFICGKEAFEFETKASGFRHHVRKEHNMWSYLFYFVYLYETKVKDYTALDMHVFNLWKQKSGDYFPLDRALALEEADDDEKKAELKKAEANELILWLLSTKNEKSRYNEKREKEIRQRTWKADMLKLEIASDDEQDTGDSRA